MLLGAEAPEDRRWQAFALDLIHAARTGQFPEPGGPSGQGRRVEELYRLILEMTIQSERGMRAASKPQTPERPWYDNRR